MITNTIILRFRHWGGKTLATAVPARFFLRRINVQSKTRKRWAACRAIQVEKGQTIPNEAGNRRQRMRELAEVGERAI